MGDTAYCKTLKSPPPRAGFYDLINLFQTQIKPSDGERRQSHGSK